jgi:DNA-binding MarR family transcriptional regulator
MSTKQRNGASAPAVRSQENAVRELIRTFGLLERVMEPYFARFGISGAKWGVLRNLHRAEQEGLAGLRLTDLGNRLLITPPSVTGVVDRLARAGLVVRCRSPADLRAKRVALTQEGRQLVDRVLQVHEHQIDAVLGPLAKDEREDLQRLLAKLGQHLQELLTRGETAHLAAAPPLATRT